MGRRLNLEPLDQWFLVLRAMTLVAGFAWWWLAPDWTRAPQLPILGMFVVFSIGLYTLNAVRPGRLRILYRVALVFDLAVVAFLVRITGGWSSDLHLAYILLIALHAFYFGMVTGVATAIAAATLYLFAGDWPPPMPQFALRTAFFGLVGLCMGGLAEQARRRREEVEQQQEHLIRSDRLATVGELAAGLAHELRNPLAGIAGALHVLGGQLGRDGDHGALLADVQVQITRMNRTLTELLRHARPVTPERTAVDVNDILESSLRFVPRGSLEVVRQFDGALPLLHLDADLIHQAFINILVNARQAMPQGGRLTVRTAYLNGSRRTVEVSITDTGIGIAPEHTARIFDAFFTTKPQGTGLGLAIAARVVEQHGGRVGVESIPGRGTTFTVTLPTGDRTPARAGGNACRHGS